MSSIEGEARAVLDAAHEALGPSDRERQRAHQRFAAALGVVPVGIGLGWSGGAGMAAGAVGQGGAAAGVVGSATTAGASTAATATGTAGSEHASPPFFFMASYLPVYAIPLAYLCLAAFRPDPRGRYSASPRLILAAIRGRFPLPRES